MTDTGSLPIKIGKKVDAKGYSLGERSDGSVIAFKPEDANSRNVKAWNVTSCMIDKLKHRGMISLDQYDAASRFLDDFEQAGLRPSTGCSYEPREGGSGGEMTDKAALAHKRWQGAVRAAGPRYGDLVCVVVLFDRDVLVNELSRLRNGLSRLVKHYGFR